MFMKVSFHLKEGKILILIDLNCKDRVSRGLSKTTQTHLGIEEVHHGFLCERERGDLKIISIDGETIKNTNMKQTWDTQMRFEPRFKKSNQYPVPHLCDTKGDVADVEPAGLPGHLAAHYRYWGGSNSQAIWSHGWQEGCGWDLACSWGAKTKTGDNLFSCLYWIVAWCTAAK